MTQPQIDLCAIVAVPVVGPIIFLALDWLLSRAVPVLQKDDRAE